MKRRLGILIAVAALVLAVTPVYANVVHSADLSATCENFTMTFYGEGFAPGEVITIDWQIVALMDGVRVVQTGQSVLSYDGTSTPSLTVTVPWTAGPLCVPVQLLPPALDDGQGCRFSWVSNMGPSGADRFQFVGPSEFVCECKPPVLFLCRTPGFWGTHAGTEKGGTNITQAVINFAPDHQLVICGQIVSNTQLRSQLSALEAECVSIKGEQRLQLARQLTAAALNSIVSNGGPDCSGVPLGQLFSDCNAACLANNDPRLMQACIMDMDCVNNGGNVLANGMCQKGTCSVDESPCTNDSSCGLDPNGLPQTCVPTPDTCHTRPLVNPDIPLDFDPPGPAGSSRGCNDATKNRCNIFSCR